MTPHEFKMTEGKQESGMLHNQIPGYQWHQPIHQQAAGDSWPWPTSDPRVIAQTEAANAKYQEKCGDEQPVRIDLIGFDSEAHRAFMRSLG